MRLIALGSIVVALSIWNAGMHFNCLGVPVPRNGEHALSAIQTTISAEPSLSPNEWITIKLKMRNTSKKDVRLKYYLCIENHLDLLDSSGKVVFRRPGAPTLECPYDELVIKAEERAELTMGFCFETYYSVSPGSYSLRLWYDRRLGADVKDNNPWVLWGKTELTFKTDDRP